MANQSATPQEIARARGHQVQPDPPFMSSADRWTCTACGRAVIVNGPVIYGSATTNDCTSKNAMDPRREAQIRAASAAGEIPAELDGQAADGDWRDFTRELLRELDRLRPLASARFLRLGFSDGTLTVPVSSDTSTLIYDSDPSAQTYRFNPRGIVVNSTRLQSVRVLAHSDLADLEIPADTQVHWHAAKQAWP